MTPAGHPSSAAREEGGGALVAPLHSPEGALAGHPRTHACRGAPKRGVFGTSQPLPKAWGQGRGGGSRWQQLPLGPSPARSPRPEDQLLELSRAGGAAASAAGRGVGGAGPGGDFLPPGAGPGNSLRKGQARPSRSCPESSQAGVLTSRSLVGLRCFRLGQWSSLGRGELCACAGCGLNNGRE